MTESSATDGDVQQGDWVAGWLDGFRARLDGRTPADPAPPSDASADPGPYAVGYAAGSLRAGELAQDGTVGHGAETAASPTPAWGRRLGVGRGWLRAAALVAATCGAVGAWRLTNPKGGGDVDVGATLGPVDATTRQEIDSALKTLSARADGGAATKHELRRLAVESTDRETRRAAIRYVAERAFDAAADVLLDVVATEKDPFVRREVVQLLLDRDLKGRIDAARAALLATVVKNEPSPELALQLAEIRRRGES